MVRYIKGFVNALSMFILGMALMGRMYCINLGITSGPMYIGWDTVAVVLGALAGIRLLMLIDPAFKEQ